jgi:hypothetical protein
VAGALAGGLNQRHIAQACAGWIRDKVEVRSVTRTGFLHGKLSHIHRGEVSAAILGSSNFTTRGLGLAASNNNVELNLVVDSNRDREDLHRWFEELWKDDSCVEDVKQRVLDILQRRLQPRAGKGAARRVAGIFFPVTTKGERATTSLSSLVVGALAVCAWSEPVESSSPASRRRRLSLIRERYRFMVGGIGRELRPGASLRNRAE